MSYTNKRLIKELRALFVQQNQKPLLQNDYLIYFDDENLNTIEAVIKAPSDSVYKHKFIRLQFKIPDNYPHSPPEVYFINHDGVRIHPNMYENGKCCSTILNTWGDSKFEKWTSSMGIETILLTFHSFLDNNPYTYEPGGRDDDSYTVYVQYQSWYACLIRYLQYEKIELFIQFIHNYLLLHVDQVINDLTVLKETYPFGSYHSRCFEIDNYIINYDAVIGAMLHYYNYIVYTENVATHDDQVMTYQEFIDKDYACSICYDTQTDEHRTISLSCGHSFHGDCLNVHVQNNNNVCPMCRNEISNDEMTRLQRHLSVNTAQQGLWIINPLTKRRVKVGSRTYQYLKDNNIIH